MHKFHVLNNPDGIKDLYLGAFHKIIPHEITFLFLKSRSKNKV
jgi:hypothetical protein